MKLLKLLIFTVSICNVPISLVAGEIQYAKWKVIEENGCSLETSNMQNTLSVSYFDSGTNLLGKISSLEITGRTFLGGTKGWAKCDVHTIGKKMFNFCRNGNSLELVAEDDCFTSILNIDTLKEFLFYFSQNPTLTCYSIEDVDNYEVIELASFDALGAREAIARFNQCTSKI